MGIVSITVADVSPLSSGVSVKDVPEHFVMDVFVKDVMVLNTAIALPPLWLIAEC